MKKALFLSVLLYSTSSIADTISVERETFCGMYESLLASTGLMEAAEIAKLDKQLPGYTHSKAGITNVLTKAEKQWDSECIGVKQTDAIEHSVSPVDKFHPTEEQAKRLGKLAAEWAYLKGAMLDTTEISTEIEKLQNEIRANNH